MASPSFSSAVQFVKKYPIALCGLSLLFMPSVYHLLLYFTPLLLSTAIFVLAMVSWGPDASAESSTRRPRLLDEHPEWTFDENVAVTDDDGDGDRVGDDDEEEEEAADDGQRAATMAEEASPLGNGSMNLRRREVSGNGGAHSDVGSRQWRLTEPRLEPDPDAEAMEGAAAMEAAAIDANCPSPAADGTGTADGFADCQACQAEPDPDVPDGSACAAHDDRCHDTCHKAIGQDGGDADAKHAKNGHDTCHKAIGQDGGDADTLHAKNGGGSLASSHRMGRAHHHADGLMRAQDAAPAQHPSHCLQVCA